MAADLSKLRSVDMGNIDTVGKNMECLESIMETPFSNAF